MGAVSEIVGNAGPRHRLTYDGKVYEFKLIGQYERSAFEKRMFERARDAERLLKDDREPADYTRRLDELSERYRLGQFALLSQAGLDYAKSIPGAQFLLGQIIVHEDGSTCTETEIVGLLMGSGAECLKMLQVVLQESFPGIDVKPAEKPPQNPVDALRENAEFLDKQLAGAAAVPN